MDEITSWDDRIDSRDVLTRIDELVAERDAYTEDPGTSAWPWDLGNPDEASELALLTKLINELREGGHAGDTPEDGIFLIRESHFRDYAEELWEDTTDSDARPTSWPYTCIDWDEAAADLRQDYTSIEFDDVTYYYQ